MRCLCLQLGSVRRGTRVTHFVGSWAQCEGTPMSRLNKPAFFLCTRPKPLRQGEARRGAEGDGPAGGPRGSAMRTGEQTSDVRVGCGLSVPRQCSQGPTGPRPRSSSAGVGSRWASAMQGAGTSPPARPGHSHATITQTQDPRGRPKPRRPDAWGGTQTPAAGSRALPENRGLPRRLGCEHQRTCRVP